MTMTFKLKCVLCGKVEDRPADECRGNDPPACSMCFGPMTLERVTAKQGRKRNDRI
jgi:hypothetical protein